MLRSHFKFAACVLYIIFISSVLSATFGDFCSNDLSCLYRLICSNASRCICPISSFWNVKQNSCLSCPQGWSEWQNEKCLLFIAPAEGGIIQQKARNACLTHSAQLLQINNHQDFIQFQYKIDELLENKSSNAAIELLSNGIWIDSISSTKQTDSYDWCDMKHGDDLSPWQKCGRVMKKYSKNNSVTSVCLSPAHCNAKLPYICERLAEIVKVNFEANHFINMERAWSAMIGPIINLAGSLFGSNQQPAPEPQQPEIQVISIPSESQAQLPPTSSSSNNHFIFYIALAVIIIIIIIVILFCLCGGGLLYLHTTNNDSSIETRTRRHLHSRHNRTSTDTTASDSSYVSH